MIAFGRAALFVSFFAVLDSLYVPLFKDIFWAYASVVAFSLRFTWRPMSFLCVPLVIAIMLFSRHFSAMLVMLYALPVSASFAFERILVGRTQARLAGAVLIVIMWTASSWGAQPDAASFAANLLIYWFFSLLFCAESMHAPRRVVS